MTPFDLLRLMGECGWMFKRTDIADGFLYFDKMIADERVLTFKDGDKLVGFIAFSVCNDYEPFWRKNAWKYLPHQPLGGTVFIDHMAFIKFSKSIKTDIERALAIKYPDFERGIWRRRRMPEDKLVIIKRSIYEKV